MWGEGEGRVRLVEGSSPAAMSSQAPAPLWATCAAVGLASGLIGYVRCSSPFPLES